MAVLLHPLSEGVQPPPVVFSTEYERRTLAQDREIVDRILAAYHHARGSASWPTRRAMRGTVWGSDGFVGGYQRAFIQALEKRSVEETHGILRQFHVTDAAHGIAMGKAEAESIRTNPAVERHHGLMWLDRLVGLAEGAGALAFMNPEDNFEAWQKGLEVDVEQVVAAIERRIGVALEFPDVTGVYGAALRGRPMPLIAFTHLLVALSIRPWVSEDGGSHVIEIGGGFGSLAYWTAKLMPCRYTIYDLPFANAAQAYFLWRVRDGAPLRLSGEGPPQPGEIALLPGWAMLDDPPPSAQVLVNQDSLAEIPRGVAIGYLTAARRFLDGPFLSVNHESWQRLAEKLDRTSVAELIAAAGGYVRLSRGPFALRQGYVQEIYARAGATLRPGTRAEQAGDVTPAAPADPLHRLKRLFAR